MSGWLDPEEQRAWRAFLAAQRAVAAAVEAQLQRDAGLPHTYYEILVHLSEAPGQTLRMGELARACGSSRSRLSHAVARLEESGWVQRRTCPVDGRGQFAVLTAQGLAQLCRAAPGHAAQVRRSVFDRLTREQVTQLQRIGEAIARDGEGGGEEGSEEGSEEGPPLTWAEAGQPRPAEVGSGAPAPAG